MSKMVIFTKTGDFEPQIGNYFSTIMCILMTVKTITVNLKTSCLAMIRYIFQIKDVAFKNILIILSGKNKKIHKLILVYIQYQMS